MAGAWELFPEHRRDALRTCVHLLSYVEINWLDGRTVIVKQKPRPEIPTFTIAELNAVRKRKRRDEEETE